jgi:hypothetical protein
MFIKYIYICICIRIYISTTISDYIYIRLCKYVSSFPPKFRTYEGPFNSMIYPLVMTICSPWYRWPIEIDGLPSNSMGILHGELLVTTRGYLLHKHGDFPWLPEGISQ